MLSFHLGIVLLEFHLYFSVYFVLRFLSRHVHAVQPLAELLLIHQGIIQLVVALLLLLAIVALHRRARRGRSTNLAAVGVGSSWVDHGSSCK